MLVCAVAQPSAGPKKNAQRALAEGGDQLDIAWRPEWYPSVEIEDAVPIIECVSAKHSNPHRLTAI